MSQADIAGSIVAHKRAKGRVVTRAVSAFEFHKPVYVGDLVSCYATIAKIGTTSITVDVDVYVERDRGQFEHVQVARATLVYVALDADRRPRPVPAE